MPKHLSLGVPDEKTFHVELHAAVWIRANTLYDPLLVRNRLLAGVTGLPGARTAPDSRDAIVRKTAISKLFQDDETESLITDSVLIQGEALQRHGPVLRATLTGVSTPERQPVRPGCRRIASITSRSD